MLPAHPQKFAYALVLLRVACGEAHKLAFNASEMPQMVERVLAQRLELLLARLPDAVQLRTLVGAQARRV